MNIWLDWKVSRSVEDSVLKVDHLDSSALFWLFENSCRMGNDSNNNVNLATVDPSLWMDDISNIILDNVGYITKNSTFNITSYIDGKLVCKSYSCESLEFSDLDSLKEFIKDRGTFSVLTIHSIVKYVFLNTLTVCWRIRCKEITDIQSIRNNKIDYITNEPK